MEHFIGHTFFFAVIVAFSLDDLVSGMTCYDCTRIPNPADCAHVVECVSSSVCSIEEMITDSGLILFSVGCRPATRCKGNKRLIGKRDVTGDIIVCEACCHSDFCNNNGCGSNSIPSIVTRGPLCFDCPEFDGFCDTIALCQADQVCFVTTTHSLSGKHQTAECGPKKTCDAFLMQPTAIGRREPAACTACCHQDYCNRNCTAAQSHSPATHAATVMITKNPTSTKPTTCPPGHPQPTDKPNVNCTLLETYLNICNAYSVANIYCPATCKVC